VRFVVKKMAALRTSARHDTRDWGAMLHSEGMLRELSKQCKNKTSENLCAYSGYLWVTKQLSRKPESKPKTLHNSIQYFAPKPAVTLQKNFSTEEELNSKY